MLTRRLLVLCLLAASPLAAQTTRVETIAEEQAQKAKALGVEGPGKAERVVMRLISSPLLAARIGPYPWFGSVYPGSGFAAGVGYLNKLPWGGSFNAATGISFNYSKVIEAQLELPELARGKFKINTMVQHLDVKDVSFYGIGPDSAPQQRRGYDYQPDEMGVDAVFRPGRWFSMSVGTSRLGLTSQRHDVDDDPQPRPRELAPGIGRNLTYNVTRATAAIDWRPAQGYNTRGGLYRATWQRHNEANDKPWDFRTSEYEVIQLLPLVHEQFVLAFRSLVTLSHTNGGDQVPLVLAPFVGGGSSLRGFRNRRFTDRNRVLVNGEYRWRPSRYLDMAVFLDAGQVAEHQKQFRFSSFETAWGAGFRLHGPTFTALRVEAAKGREGWVVVFGGGQTF
ncbi:MAG: BamA/TamA family outer membrane protein [Vicinamibacterales bacterium]